jgi:hypothetical protein
VREREGGDNPMSMYEKQNKSVKSLDTYKQDLRLNHTNIIIIGRVPTRNFRDFTVFPVDSKRRNYLSARCPSTSNAICGHAGTFKQKPILLTDFFKSLF